VDAWQLTYQSRFGREPWLGPATVDTLQALGAAGVRLVDVVCPGFATDCLETLEEIAMVNAAAFARTGGTLRYVPALNDAPAHVAALASLVRRTLERQA
jgi:ferrochelatase